MKLAARRICVAAALAIFCLAANGPFVPRPTLTSSIPSIHRSRS